MMNYPVAVMEPASSFAMSSVICDGVDYPVVGNGCDSDDLEFDDFGFDVMELQTECFSVDTSYLAAGAVPATAAVCSTVTSPLPSVVDGNAHAVEAQWDSFAAAPCNDFEFDQDFDFDQDVLLEMYAECPVITKAQDFEAHFFRNVNVTDLSDDLVHRIRIFYQRQIASITSMTELKKFLEGVCLEKKELVKSLSLISEPSSKTAAQLKEELKSKQTSQSRDLLLALVANHAMFLMQQTQPALLNHYCNQMECIEQFSSLWQEPPSSDDMAFITKCMGVFHVVHKELQLDCCAGLGKKGLVITAAVMIADSSRTYTNGGSQAKCIQILEGMFHRITGYTVKARGTKRNADDMSV